MFSDIRTGSPALGPAPRPEAKNMTLGPVLPVMFWRLCGVKDICYSFEQSIFGGLLSNMSASSDSSTSRSTTVPGGESVPVPESDESSPSTTADDVCATCPKRRRSCPKYPHERTKSAQTKEPPHYTVGEEIANSITHGIGVLLGIAGLVLLIVKAALGGAEPAHMASAIVFGISIILEYLASTLYHAIQVPAAKRIFRIIDHSCIYLLIAGSYTPFLLVTLEPYGGIVMFVIIWALTFAGISFEIIGRQRQPRWVSILIYLIMGWLVVFRLPQLVAALDPLALALLVVGGLCYTIGTAFYLMKQVRYMHSVWHLWVLAGSIFIYMVVILFVI